MAHRHGAPAAAAQLHAVAAQATHNAAPVLIGTQALDVRIAGGQYRLTPGLALGAVRSAIGRRCRRRLGGGNAAGQHGN